MCQCAFQGLTDDILLEVRNTACSKNSEQESVRPGWNKLIQQVTGYLAGGLSANQRFMVRAGVNMLGRITCPDLLHCKHAFADNQAAAGQLLLRHPPWLAEQHVGGSILRASR